MCSRYVPADPIDAKRVFKARLALPKEYEVKPGTYPGYQAPVVLLSGKGEREVEGRFWGLVTRIPGKKDPSKLLERITFNPKQCGGRPCVRGMRIRVIDVLDLFAAGLDAAQILKELPDLEADDLKACLLFARRRIDHPTLAA